MVRSWRDGQCWTITFLSTVWVHKPQLCLVTSNKLLCVAGVMCNCHLTCHKAHKRLLYSGLDFIKFTNFTTSSNTISSIFGIFFTVRVWCWMTQWLLVHSDAMHLTCAIKSSLPKQWLRTICANIKTHFQTKTVFSHVQVNQTENIFSHSMRKQKYAHKHFLFNLTVTHASEAHSLIYLHCKSMAILWIYLSLILYYNSFPQFYKL